MGCSCSSGACATTDPAGYQKVADVVPQASSDPATEVPAVAPRAEKTTESFVWVEELQVTEPLAPTLLQDVTVETQEVEVRELCAPPSKEPKLPWARFLRLWACCCVASGVLPGQAFFVELLADAGVFRSTCEDAASGCADQLLVLTSVFGVCQSLAYGFSAPIGLLYDRWGARNVGTAGALCCAVGLLLMCWSVLGAASGHDFLTCKFVAVGVLLCDLGSMLNSFAFIGLIWHFPHRQTLVIALINSTYQASAVLPVLLKGAVECLELPLYLLMLAWTSVVFLSVWLCSASMPTQMEFFEQAKQTLGTPLPKLDNLGVRQMICGAVEVLELHQLDHLVSGFALASGLALPGVYSSLAAPYAEQLFRHSSDGKRLVEINALCTAVVGLVLGPLAGMLSDSHGLEALVALLVSTLTLACATVGVPYWPAQVLCGLSTVLFMNIFSIYVSRYILLYAPPGRFGSVQGVYSAAVVLMSTPWSLAGMAAVSLLPPGLNEYRVPMLTFGLLGVLLLMLHAAYSRGHPPPDCPPLLPEDEAELAKRFGCRTLDEVCQVTGSKSKFALIKKMGSKQPEDVLSLLAGIDVHKMKEMMATWPAEDIADMMEMEDSVVQDVGEYADEAELVQPAAQVDAAAQPGDQVSSPEDRSQEGVRARSRYWARIVAASDAQAVRDYLLTEPVEDLWKAALDLEKWQTLREQTRMDKDLNKIIPNKEFAHILRRRPELNNFVQNVIVREMGRKAATLRSRRKNTA